MSRAYNFSAGPAVLPLEVLQDAQKDLVDYKGCGMSVMEMSHRGKDYDAIHQEAIATFKELCGLGDDWAVCFIQGGASMQFAMIPMNFLPKGGAADYAKQGTWSGKALKEGQKVAALRGATVNVACDCAKDIPTRMPKADEWKWAAGSAYYHLCSNETIAGAEIKDFPVPTLALTLRYNVGSGNDEKLYLLAGLLPKIGTDSLSVQELSRAWQRIGTTWTVDAAADGFAFKLKGFDASLEESVALLRHMLEDFDADKDALSDAISEYNQESMLAFVGGTSAKFSALLQKTMLGENAPLMRRLTSKELKPYKKGDGLLDLLEDEVLQTRCDVIYTGRRDAEEVAALVRSQLPLGTRKVERAITPVQSYDKPQVLFLHASGSRQTYIAAYVTDPACGMDPDRQARLKLWANYFGGGMSSVLFQEIREFRAYAYSAFAMARVPDVESVRKGDMGMCVGYLATQADKASEAMALMDSLYRNLPVSPVMARTAKQDVINGINNAIPDFRSLPGYIAALERRGLTEDPDKALYEALVPLEMDDIAAYAGEVAARPFTWIVVGDKKKMDMEKLAEYGEIVYIKKKDLIRK